MRKSNGFTRRDGGENQVVVVVRAESDGDGGRGRVVPKGKKGEGGGDRETALCLQQGE